MKDIIKNLKEKLNKEIFIITVSTGPDSMALLDMCLKAGLQDNLVIAHVNHGLRCESNSEEEYITNFAKDHNLKIEVKHLSGFTKNIEEEARNARYTFFKEVANKYQAKYILLAHNADDLLETILMRLIKSSSIKAYAGIEKESQLDDFVLYRPLLGYSKQELLAYCNDNNVKYFIDKTNNEDTYLRNRIRKYITPVLLDENPKLYDAVNYFSTSLLGVNELLEKEKVNFIDKYVTITPDTRYFKYQPLLDKGEYLEKAILFRILRPYDLSVAKIEEIIKILKSDKTKVISKIDKNLNLIKEYGYVYFTSRKIEEEPYRVCINGDGEYKINDEIYVKVNGNFCVMSWKNKELCYNNIDVPYTIRTRLDGDRIKRISKKGTYYQKVNNILTIKKIPTLDKLYMPVIEKDNEIIAIVGLQIK